VASDGKIYLPSDDGSIFVAGPGWDSICWAKPPSGNF
jgi:hypothetical protein